jgi:hypothetical protein
MDRIQKPPARSTKKKMPRKCEDAQLPQTAVIEQFLEISYETAGTWSKTGDLNLLRVVVVG